MQTATTDESMEIFQKYTNENHRLSQKEIADIL